MGVVLFALILLGGGIWLSFKVSKSHRGDDPLDEWRP
jgi:hypothetical protein